MFNKSLHHYIIYIMSLVIAKFMYKQKWTTEMFIPSEFYLQSPNIKQAIWFLWYYKRKHCVKTAFNFIIKKNDFRAFYVKLKVKRKIHKLPAGWVFLPWAFCALLILWIEHNVNFFLWTWKTSAPLKLPLQF